MPKENVIRKKFKAICEENKWAVWFPARVKFYENDIFGIADAIISTPYGIELIQLTTLSNMSARKKKIQKVLETKRITCIIEVWGLRKDGTFKIIKI